MKFCSVIRTFNSESTLDECLRMVCSQHNRPSRIIIVDSGSNDGTLEIARSHGAEIVHYPKDLDFNYSRSLNVGIEASDDPFVFILSSHTVTESPEVTARMLDQLERDPSVVGVYVVPTPSGSTQAKEFSVQRIDGSSFDGFNGLWNTCSMIRRSSWQSHPFSEDAWIAEDQEWAGHFFAKSPQFGTIRLEGLLVRYKNARANRWKQISEFVSIATFSKTDLCPTPLCLTRILGLLKNSNGWRQLRRNSEFVNYVCLLLYRLRILRFRSNYQQGPPSYLRWLG